MRISKRPPALQTLLFLGSLLWGLSACAILTSPQTPTATPTTPTKTPETPRLTPTPSLTLTPSPTPTRRLPTPTRGFPFVATFAAAPTGLWIQDAQVRLADDGLVEGKFTVVNSGPDEATMGYVFSSSYTVLIFDQNDQLVFQMRGAWSPLDEGKHLLIPWDTKYNHIGKVSGPSYRPDPGKYTVKMQLEVWKNRNTPNVPDEETIAIEVP